MKRKTEKDFFFSRDLNELDPDVAELISLEEERQMRKLILIASESICPRPVREALASVFTNLYAEGYPHLRMSQYERDRLLDYDRQMAYLRRYSDRRYYKGTDYVNFVEALAQRRIAELFATDRDPGAELKIPSSSIFANVQPLSGAAANNAIYEAFLKPGDTVLGMALTHGGHLTHGSAANRSGRSYSIVPYGVDEKSGRLDYGDIERLAVEHRPKMIIAGYSAYPWSVDWRRFAHIRDVVGDCILMADIAHPAGLVAAGVYPNPVGYADVITFTTHKTLCGPRGACILTTDEEKARQVDAAVFPGEQGGPHINNIAAKAICFQVAKSPDFKELGRRIVDNAKYFASCLESLGLKLAYGGTDTHLLLLDLRGINNGREIPLTAEVATRILDMCGIVANKNTIAGDDNAVYPSGVRFGTTWITQRGVTKGQLRRLAQLIHNVLVKIRPYEYIGATCVLGRGKTDLGIIEETALRVEEIERGLKRDINLEKRRGYPHYIWSSDSPPENPVVQEYRRLGAFIEEKDGCAMPVYFDTVDEEIEQALSGAVLFDRQDAGLLEVYGERAYAFVQGVVTTCISDLAEGGCKISYLLNGKGEVIDDVIVVKLSKDSRGEDHFLICTNPENRRTVKSWLRALSDGYVIFDADDIRRKIEGPVVVVDLKSDVQTEKMLAVFSLQGPRAEELIPSLLPPLRDLPKGTSKDIRLRGLRFRALHLECGDESRFEFLLRSKDVRKFLKQLRVLSPGRALVLGGTAAREKKRLQYGFPQYGEKRAKAKELIEVHPELFGTKKTYFIGQDSVPPRARVPSSKKVFRYERKEGVPKSPWLVQEHSRLGGKLIEFAGWRMPVWYTGLSDEHAAVRQTAGLFDVSHMGVLEVKGEHATRFLDLSTTNYASFLRVGQSQYSYLLYPNGEVIDDIMIYRREQEKYFLVVNAVNEEKDKAWLDAVNSKEYCIDLDNHDAEIDADVLIRDLKDSCSGKDMIIDLALQGPNSLLILKELTRSHHLRRRLEEIMRGEFIEIELCNIQVMVSRTGYTGESIGYELFVHPNQATKFWRILLEKGEKYGIKPVGLAARDSTRIEAGLPLYGHELAGPYGISPIEAGYGAFVKLHKPFFIGRERMKQQALRKEAEVARFRMNKSGQRLVKHGDAIVSPAGESLGHVTSCTLVRGVQQGIGYVKKTCSVEGTPILILCAPRVAKEGPLGRPGSRDETVAPIEATILTRFPERSRGFCTPE